VNHCLHLSCASLTKVHCKPVLKLQDHDLATTLEHPDVARHLVHYLQEADQEYIKHGVELRDQLLFAFASLFQLYLDIFALIFKNENPREPPSFPARPEQRTQYKTGEWDLGRTSDRWRKRLDIKRSLCEDEYWAEHPLLRGGWTSLSQEEHSIQLSNIFEEASDTLIALPGSLLDTSDGREFTEEEWNLVDKLRSILPQISAELRDKHSEFKLKMKKTQKVSNCCVIL